MSKKNATIDNKEISNIDLQKQNNLKASIRNGWCFFHTWRNLGFFHAHFYGRRYQPWLMQPLKDVQM